MKTRKARGLILIALLLSWWCLPARGSGLTWPASQFLPTFSSPTGIVQCIDMDSLPATQQALFVSLEGLVNRIQPRLACVSAASEGEFTWMVIHNVHYAAINGFAAIYQFETNVTGLVVTDPNQPDTLNLATTIAGVKNELICDPSLLSILTNSPYNLPIKDDLRGMFTNNYQVYGYLYTNYWSQCTHRVIAGLETNSPWYLRDYLVAVKSAVVWLDPGSVSADAAALAPFVSGMSPANSVYLGWWPNEGNDMEWIGPYGIPVMASDYFDNATIYSGVASAITIPPIPPCPPLQNKVYVSLTLSDGDNVQYMQHAMKLNWDTAARGAVPLGWTVQPLAADFDPGMLNYYSSTATTNDCLVAGPSGAGYARINYWSAANVAADTKASNPYLQRTGIRMITVWLTVSSATGDTYATNCPTLLGITDQSDGYYTTHDGVLPVLGLPANGSYASTVAGLASAITNAAANWNGSSPMFIAAQGSAWDITPADCETITNLLPSSQYVLVRPDQLFLMYQEASGRGQGGAAPYVAVSPASVNAGVGSNATFSVTVSGTGPLSYQWSLNGTNLAGATNSVYAQTNVPSSAAGNYQVIVTNLYGAATSSVATLTFGSQPLGLNGNGLNWVINQNNSYTVASTPAAAGNVLTLTDGAGGEVRSCFYSQPQYIGTFQASFTYQAGGNKGADGASFCLQNDPRGSSALGGSGGQLGVGTGSPITPSLELELNLYTGNGQNAGYTVLTNGLTGASGGNGNYHAPGTVQVNGGDPINIALRYANPQMTLAFTDTVTQATFVTNLNVGDLTQIMGTNTAYAGFTGADGGSTSIQTVSHFSFVSIPPASIQTQGGNILVSWSAGAPGYVLQQSSNLTANGWVNVTNPNFSANGLSQTTLPGNGGGLFYRLVLP